MFELLTDQSRRVIVVAQELSRRFAEDHIGTAHVALALAEVSAATPGPARVVLDSFGVSAQAMEDRYQPNGAPQGAPSGHIPFTPNTKRLIGLSEHEAIQLGHIPIDIEHLLLALVAESDTTGARLLATFAELEQIRAAVLAQVAEMSDEPNAPAPTGLVPPSESLRWPPMTGEPSPCLHPSPRLMYETGTIPGPHEDMAVRVVRCGLCMALVGVLPG